MYDWIDKALNLTISSEHCALHLQTGSSHDSSHRVRCAAIVQLRTRCSAGSHPRRLPGQVRKNLSKYQNGPRMSKNVSKNRKVQNVKTSKQMEQHNTNIGKRPTKNQNVLKCLQERQNKDSKRAKTFEELPTTASKRGSTWPASYLPGIGPDASLQPQVPISTCICACAISGRYLK